MCVTYVCVLRMYVCYVCMCVTYVCVLRMYVCYVCMCVTYVCVLRMYVCYVCMCVTYVCVLRMYVCYATLPRWVALHLGRQTFRGRDTFFFSKFARFLYDCSNLRTIVRNVIRAFCDRSNLVNRPLHI